MDFGDGFDNVVVWGEELDVVDFVGDYWDFVGDDLLLELD